MNPSRVYVADATTLTVRCGSAARVVVDAREVSPLLTMSGCAAISALNWSRISAFIRAAVTTSPTTHVRGVANISYVPTSAQPPVPDPLAPGAPAPDPPEAGSGPSPAGAAGAGPTTCHRRATSSAH